VAALASLLDDEDEGSRDLAAHALGKIGPMAAPAIPALEKLLTSDKNACAYTFAGYALWRIGKASVPALIRATAPESGGRYSAIVALGFLGKDASPAAIECLIRVLSSQEKEDPGPLYAACALASLGEHARAARQALEKCRDGERNPNGFDNDRLIMFIRSALMQIPK
jgi:HEAT repeat protein